MTRARVAYQGEPGAFAEEAARTFFAAANVAPVPTWRGVFEAVRDGVADAGAVPIENSLVGTIRENHDLLYEFHDDGIRIHGEVSVPVRLALLALPDQRIDQIERVYSHPQALAQADAFLRTRSWQVMTTYNTAGAAKLIAEGAERGAAAIAAPRVAAMYGLTILADGVQTGQGDRTRFAIVAGRPLEARVADEGHDRRRAADHDRVRGAERAGVPASLSRGVRGARAQPVAARVPALGGARDALGIPVLGRPRRRPGRTRGGRGARGAERRDGARQDPRDVPPRARGLIAGRPAVATTVRGLAMIGSRRSDPADVH